MRQMVLRIDPSSEVLLNGQPCRLEDVPADAVVLRIEVSGELKILRIHFQTGK